MKEAPVPFQEDNQYCRKDIIFNGKSVLKPEPKGLDFLEFIENPEAYDKKL